MMRNEQEVYEDLLDKARGQINVIAVEVGYVVHIMRNNQWIEIGRFEDYQDATDMEDILVAKILEEMQREAKHEE